MCHSCYQTSRVRANPILKKKAYELSADWLRRNPDKSSSYVKKYRATDKGRDTKLRYLYGITLEHWNAMYEAQDGACVLCFKTEKLVVDHDHETGRVRGLLCYGCNSHIVAQFDRDPEIVARLISYTSTQDRPKSSASENTRGQSSSVEFVYGPRPQ